MWHHLSLRHLGVIESAELELGPGFTVITGETGAGKTMVVTALGLLRGERADLGLVRRGADQARVEATVLVPEGSGVAGIVEDAGGAVEDGSVVLARALSAQGRSRAFAGGVTVPASVLSDVTDELVAVHGQSDQHRLVRGAAQRTALDTFAAESVAGLLEEYRPAHARLRALEERLLDLETHAQERARELDLLRHGLDEIAAVAPEDGEDEHLAAEEGRLAHAESLAGAAAVAHTVLAGDDEGVARDLVARAVSDLGDVAGHDPALDAIAGRVREAGLLLDEASGELSAYASSVDVDPARLAVVQDRIAALTGLRRKYGPGLSDVLAWQEKAVARVGDLDLDDDAVEGLRAEAADLERELRALAARLHRARDEAGARLATKVDAELAELSMASARLTVAVRPTDQLGPDGADEVEFLFAANSGMDPRPLAKGASGGELSRLMLALEVVLADRTTVPTLVFDEVDAGIGGRAAVEVGRRLARLAENAQVLAVTHLPQVAAFADRHFHVRKDDDGAVTSSSVTALEGQERVDELARMLAGQDDSASAQAHARELLALRPAR